MASCVDFSKTTFAVVTGASQGIGRTIAVELAKRLGKDSTISLIARSEQGLLETKNLIVESRKDIIIQVHPLDLTHPNEKDYENIVSIDLKAEQAIIVHNVGQIGTLDKAIELTDIHKWRDYFDLNVFNVGMLNSYLIKKLRDKAQKLIVINITSLCGRQPFDNLAMYGSGKAARELYFRAFANEEKDVIVLNYSPGPVDTAMVGEIITSAKSEEIKSMFVDLKEKKTILTPVQTVEKLITILEKGDFKSGDVIDYFDRV